MREDWDEDMDLQKELQNIEAWEKEQKQVFFWEKLSRLPFMLLDKVTPKLIRDKLGDLLGEMGRFLQTGGQYLVQPKSVLKLLEQNRQQHSGTLAAGGTIDEPQGGLTLEQARELPLAIMDTDGGGADPRTRQIRSGAGRDDGRRRRVYAGRGHSHGIGLVAEGAAGNRGLLRL